VDNMLLENTRIHCIGSSHVCIFTGTDKLFGGIDHSYDTLTYFKTYQLGAVLAYSIGTPGHSMYNLIHEIIRNISKDQWILLCFGEIDCRAHLIKQKEIQNRTIESVTEECTNKYFSTISELKDQGNNLIIWGAIPTYDIDVDKDSTEPLAKIEYPYYGIAKERNYATKYFNDLLEKYCNEKDIKFGSIFDDLINSNGLRKNEYFLDAIHLSTKALPLIIDKISNLLK